MQIFAKVLNFVRCRLYPTEWFWKDINNWNNIKSRKMDKEKQGDLYRITLLFCCSENPELGTLLGISLPGISRPPNSNSTACTCNWYSRKSGIIYTKEIQTADFRAWWNIAQVYALKLALIKPFPIQVTYE